MNVSAVNSYYNDYKNNSQPSFKCLIKSKSAMPIINKLSKQDTFEFQQIEKRLAKTKFWDMKISTIGSKFEEFKFYFINKRNPKNIITDGIYPFNLEGNNIRYYSIIYGPENTQLNTVGHLKLKSEKRAKELFDTYQGNAHFLINRNYNITPIESLKIKEVELKMLEEASEELVSENDVTMLSTKFQTKTTIGNDLSPDE